MPSQAEPARETIDMLGGMVAVGDTLAGRYRIEAQLGAGGMATVYRATDDLLGRRVAVKILAPNIAANATLLERFGREARAMAAISHPNVVAIFDVGWVDRKTREAPFLVMELVSGGTLAQRVAADGPLDPPGVVRLVEGLASALETLHRAGIIHRDVKPQNVLLSATGPKLADLGLIRFDDLSDPDAALTASGATPGTLRFLAPEVIFGQQAGAKADAFGLAMVAYEALTGRSPRPAVTLGDLVDAAWRPPVPVSKARPVLGTAFDTVFPAALDLDPNRRLGPRAFAAALAEAADAWQPPAVTEPASDAPVSAPGIASVTPTAWRLDPDATTIVDRPVAASLAAAEAPTGSSRGMRATLAALPASAAFAVAGVALLGVVAVVAVVVSSGGRFAFDPGAGEVTTQPSIETPVPTESPPTPSTTDPRLLAIAALADVREAAAHLERNDAKDLAKRIDEIEEALADGDRDKAVDKARDLANRVDELIREGKVTGNLADALLSSINALFDALGSTGAET